MSNRLLLIIIGLLVANLVVGIVKSPTDTASVTDDGSVGLVRPWFIDEAFASDERSARAVNNIANEAGISAYVKTPAAINLTLARTALTSEIEVNSNYLLGTITPGTYTGDFSVQVMIHRTGWIMAWYHKDQVASMVVHVKDSTLANKTKLSLAIDAVTTKLRIAAITPSYYHFKYPTANRMVIARKLANNGYEMKIGIPPEVTVLESSSYIEPYCYYGDGSKLLINDEKIFDICWNNYTLDEKDHYGNITDKLTAGGSANKLFFNHHQLAVVMIYRA